MGSPLEIECPVCGAKTDEPCKTTKGKKRPETHWARTFAYDNPILEKGM